MNCHGMAPDAFPLVAGMLYALTYPVHHAENGAIAVSLLLLPAVLVAADGWATRAYSVAKADLESVAGPKA